VYALVRDVTCWPEHLPHYRFVREVGRDPTGRQILQMSARRSGLPVTWTSVYDANDTILELRFEHLLGWTKGMKVVWTLTPTRDGTRVEIVHDLAFRWPMLAWLAEPIIGKFFIHHIAGRTLATFKDIVESRSEAPKP
jgi:ribosome-associated toxin RatA of RatAB toxin-antitoxin module